MLPVLPHDKALHLVYGYLAAVAAVLVMLAVPQLAPLPLWHVAWLAPAVVGAAKELRDHATGRGTPSLGDWLFTAAPGVPLALVVWALS